MNKHNDSELVKQCLDGDMKAFEEIVKKYQKPVFNTALRMTNNRKDAEDITQSAFLKVYENLESFNPDYKFFSWLYKISYNEILSFLKRRRPFEELNNNTISEDNNPVEKSEKNDEAAEIKKAIMKLKPDARTVILLRHYQNMSYKEIGMILDIPEKTVKSRLYSSRQYLKEILIDKGQNI